MFQKVLTKSLWVIFVLLATQSANAFGQVTINGKSYLDTVCPDRTKEPCATAKQMIVSAGVIVTGEELKGDDWTYTANAMLSSKLVGEERFRDGLKLGDAVNYWKDWLASPFTGDGNRGKVISQAYTEVYGTTPKVDEYNAWMTRIKAKQAWYTTIVGAEKSRLKGEPARRKAMINHVYYTAMGRPAAEVDYQYWMAQPEHYVQMVEANRKWLYSPNGEKDLRGAVRVALYPKLKREPTPAEIDEGVQKVKPGKLIYREMLPVLQK
jgi:hypothetical protein